MTCKVKKFNNTYLNEKETSRFVCGISDAIHASAPGTDYGAALALRNAPKLHPPPPSDAERYRGN